MDNLLLNFLVSIIGTLSSVASLVIGLMSANNSNKAFLNHTNNEPHNVVVEKKQYAEPRKWPIVIIVLVTMLSFFGLLHAVINTPEKIEWGLIVTFVVSVISLVIYAVKAYQSFDNYYILPPQRLWQTLFNKIPNHIKNTNQLVFRFLVLKMDNSEEVDKAGQKIERNYQNREDFQVDVKLYDDNTNPDDAENYCGIIFIVGKECFDRLREVQSVMDKYSKQLVLPIAYIRVGDNHYHISKYHRISESYLDKNCANHLIMRSYRRSAHWIMLSRYGHRAFWAVSCLALALLMVFSFTARKYVIQCDTIEKDEKRINSLQDSLMIFGADRSEIHLSNTYEKTALPKDIDIRELQQNKAFQNFVNDIASYFFGEVNPSKILLWLRNDLNDNLECIFDLNGDPTFNKSKGDDSMIGGIAAHKNVFVLWPGRLNKDSVWLDENKNKMAWFNDENAAFAVTELKKEDGFNTAIHLKRTNDSEGYYLRWYKNELMDQSEDNIALFGFSYDGRLALELDFDYAELNKKSKRVYIQNLVFRNTVRKFSACITSYLSSSMSTNGLVYSSEIGK